MCSFSYYLIFLQSMKTDNFNLLPGLCHVTEMLSSTAGLFFIFIFSVSLIYHWSLPTNFLNLFSIPATLLHVAVESRLWNIHLNSTLTVIKWSWLTFVFRKWNVEQQFWISLLTGDGRSNLVLIKNLGCHLMGFSNFNFIYVSAPIALVTHLKLDLYCILVG